MANRERLEGDGTSPASPERGRNDAATSPASPERGRNDAATSPASPQRGRNDADAAWSVKLPHFEGPLDLLLHLCQKHELDILEIPIAFVTEKYLEYLAVMQLMQLDLAAEYLVMAATLAHIKSKMLLPAPPPGQEDEGLPEDEIDPRDALIRRLLEYQKYKHAGEQLAARGIEGRDVFLRGTPIDEAAAEGLAPLAEIPLFSLVEAFQRVLDRSRVRLSHDVVADRISLSERIIELADLIGSRKRATFEDLFDGLGTSFELVITFLALLEMTRLKMTRLFQAEPLGPLYVELAIADSDGTSPAMPERGQNDERTSPAKPERGQNDERTSPATPERGRDDGKEGSS